MASTVSQNPSTPTTSRRSNKPLLRGPIDSPAGQLLTRTGHISESNPGSTYRRSDSVDSGALIGDANNDAILKCVDIWKFIDYYCPKPTSSSQELQQQSKRFAKRLGLGFEDNFPDPPSHSDDNYVGTESGPDSCRWFECKPAESAKSETEYFDDYVKMCNVFGQDMGKDVNIMRTVADRTLSTHAGKSYKIDGCILKKRPEDDCHENKVVASNLATTDVLVVLEYEKVRAHDEIRDNRLKIVSAVHHIMLDDVRRRFMYAVSVEDHAMTIWYFARDQCVRATFDWWQYKATMIYIFLLFMGATQADLGLDPDIHLLPPTQSYHTARYIYTLRCAKNGEGEGEQGNTETLYFRTQKSILELRSLRITGRKTRIFKVVQVDSPSDNAPHDDRPIRVLKDAWMDAEEKTERQIMEEMFQDIQAFVNLDDRDPWLKKKDLPPEFAQYLKPATKDFRDLFLCINQESTGLPLRQIQPEHLYFPAQTFYTKSAEPPNSAFMSTTCGISKVVPCHNAGEADPVNLKRRFPAKKRTFIIFNDVCKPIHKLPNIGSAIHVLKDTVIAQFLMYGANWVHRDISAGNIMAVYNPTTEQYETKLGDFQYAKVFTETPSVELKIGTPAFMAVEILRGRYFFPPLLTTELLASELAHNDVNSKIEQVPMTVTHNFYHDLEPIYWIADWTVACRVGHRRSEEYVAAMFSPNMGPNNPKEQHLQFPGILQEFEEVLLPSLQGYFFQRLDLIRRALWIDLYKRNARMSWQDKSSYSDIYPFVFLALESLDNPQSEWYEVTLQGPEQELSKLSHSNPLSGAAVSLTAPSVSTTQTDHMKGTKRMLISLGEDEGHVSRPAKKR